MNDVEDEVVELVSSVTARMLFKLLRRADPRNPLPHPLAVRGSPPIYWSDSIPLRGGRD